MSQYQHRLCPVCNTDAQMMAIPAYGAQRVRCPVCGEFGITDDAITDKIGPDWNEKWTPVRRAALAHALRLRLNIPIHQGSGLPLLDRALLQMFEKEGLALPTPIEQARNIVRFIGDHQRATGGLLESLPPEFCAIVGSENPEAAVQIIQDLRSGDQVDFSARPITGLDAVTRARLTLAGWAEWQEIHKGRRAARDGFIAMQFNDAHLDDFVSKVVQPCVLEALGVRANRLDSSEIVTAGVIDNIMREAIQNAAFVLVDLSHGNRGAYWEAGYAEGLGKPVIYLCEKAAFESVKPHFDVNHCTIVMWEQSNPEPFKLLLAATLRNAMRKAGRDV